jgi:hypothetical protein
VAIVRTSITIVDDCTISTRADRFVHPTGQKSKKYPQVDGHVLSLNARHAKLRRDGYRRNAGP